MLNTAMRAETPAVDAQPLMNAQQLWFALYDGGIGLRLDGDALEIVAAPGQLTPALRDAVRAHKEMLTDEAARLTRLRQEFGKLHEWIIRLRHRDPSGVTRAGMLERTRSRIDALAEGCGLPEGYSGPGDPFASTALAALRSEFAELIAEGSGYPVPLPDGCVLLPEANFDPFSLDPPRRYNGKLA